MSYRVFCIIPGDGPAFLVDINETLTVDHLKTYIKAVKGHTLATIDAAVLTLYQINVDRSNKEKYIEEVKCLAKNLKNLKSLNVVSLLADVFMPPGPPPQRVHILVQPPKGVSQNINVYL